MVRLELLITDNPFDLRDDLLFRKDIARKGEVVGITTISQPVFRSQRCEFSCPFRIPQYYLKSRTCRRSLRQMPVQATQSPSTFDTFSG